MTHPLDIGPNTVNFPQWPANFVQNEVTVPLAPDILQGLYAAGIPAPNPPADSTERAALRNTLSRLIQSWFNGGSTKPTSWAEFSAAVVAANNGSSFDNGTALGLPIVIPSTPVTTANVANLRAGFAGEFKELTGVNSDWSILTQPPSTIDSFFDQAFKKFMADYQLSNELPRPPISSNLNPDGDNVVLSTPPNTAYTIPAFYLDFIKQFRGFFTTSVLVQTPGSVPLQSASGADMTNQLANLASYESLYTTYAPPGTTRATFIADLQTFYTKQATLSGYFVPSQFFAAWQLFVAHLFNLPIFDENAVPLNVPAGGPSSLIENDGYRALILDRIIKLLIQMTSIIQNVAVAQTVRLHFAVAYQQVYTAMMSQIPVFLVGGPSIIERAKNPDNAPAPFNTVTGGLPLPSTQQNARNNLNATFNSVLTDKLRAYRGIYEDRAKQYQTVVNQSTDAVNQQTDMLTSFVQQIGSLLSTVLR